MDSRPTDTSVPSRARQLRDEPQSGRYRSPSRIEKSSIVRAKRLDQRSLKTSFDRPQGEGLGPVLTTELRDWRQLVEVLVPSEELKQDESLIVFELDRNQRQFPSA